MSTIAYVCPRCRNVQNAPAHSAGQTRVCPHCGQAAVVPCVVESRGQAFADLEEEPILRLPDSFPRRSSRARGSALPLLFLVLSLLLAGGVAGGWLWLQKGEKGQQVQAPSERHEQLDPGMAKRAKQERTSSFGVVSDRIAAKAQSQLAALQAEQRWQEILAEEHRLCAKEIEKEGAKLVAAAGKRQTYAGEREYEFESLRYEAKVEELRAEAEARAAKRYTEWLLQRGSNLTGTPANSVSPGD